MTPRSNGRADPAPTPARLLAVDAGLRAGLAVYERSGRLVEYRSTNFGSVSRLKRGVYGVVSGIEGLEHIVVEGGGGGFAEPWLKEAERRHWTSRAVDAGVWREVLLLPRDRRSGVSAKEQADTVARRVIEWSGARRPTSLRHDAAEAILIGLWAVLDRGWLDALPADL